MKKSFLIIFGALFACFIGIVGISTTEAGVYFITKPHGETEGINNKPCQLMDYNILAKDCGEGQKLFDKCPTNKWGFLQNMSM
ncbi:MAG: hypothetical protein PHE89_04985 [Alphaproteobacteria bacterium]|nr:hypothetical protein [Alphaproteobacteria bacterium]